MSASTSQRPFLIEISSVNPDAAAQAYDDAATPGPAASPAAFPSDHTAATPRSFRDTTTTAASTSPFFANWERSPHLAAGSPDAPGTDHADSTRRYTVDSLSLSTPLRQAAVMLASTPSLSERTIMSPLGTSAAMPGAPVMSQASTPAYTPATSPAPPHMQLFPSLTAIPSAPPPLPLPLPLSGQSEPALQPRFEEISHNDALEEPSRQSFTAARSASETSISSIANDHGHHRLSSSLSRPAVDLEPTPFPSVERERDAPHPEILPRQQSQNSMKRPSDPPLIPFAKMPHSLSSALLQHREILERPVSPFSPTELTFNPMDVQIKASTVPMPTRNKISITHSERDLINFDSDRESLRGRSENKRKLQGAETRIEYRSSEDEADGMGSPVSEPDEEEELENNPIYTLLERSGSPHVRRAWDDASLLLLPPRHTIPEPFAYQDTSHWSNSGDPLDWEIYTGLHTLRQQAGSPDVFVGSSRTKDGRRLLAKLDSSKRELELGFMPEDDDATPHANALAGADLVRSETLSTSTSSAVPPHLIVSGSPESSTESGFPVTPPVSPPLRPAISIRTASGMMQDLSHSVTANMAPLIPAPKDQHTNERNFLSRIKILGESPVYRRRRTSASAQGTPASAPVPLPQTSRPVQDLNHRMSVASLTPSMASSTSLASKAIKKRDSKVRLRVPRWLSRSSKDNIKSLISAPMTESASVPPIIQQNSTALKRQISITEDSQPLVEKLRVVRVDRCILAWPGFLVTPVSPTHVHAHETRKQVRERRSNLTSAEMVARHGSNSSRFSKRSNQMLRYKHSNASSASQLAAAPPKDFSSDIEFLLDPPRHMLHLTGLFELALRDVIRLTKWFSETFVPVLGREHMIVEQIHHKIFVPVWAIFEQEDLSDHYREQLMEVIENAIMAFLHNSVFERVVKPSWADQDAKFAHSVQIYKASDVSMSDLGVSASVAHQSFSLAISTVADLCGGGGAQRELWERMAPQSYKRLVQLISETTDSASTVIALLEAKPPLDCAVLLRKAIDELVRASENEGSTESRASLATDDLIPLLAYCMIAAGAKNLHSLLFYTRVCRLSSTSAGDVEWALVQFEAAAHYIMTDPLKLTRQPPPSPALSSQSMSPVRPMYDRRESSDSLAPPRARSRRSSVQSLPPIELSRQQSRSPVLPSGAYHHKRTMSSLPATRIVTYHAHDAGKRSSFVSTITSEEDEDNADMPPPPAPKRESRLSSDDGTGRPEISLLTHSRHRSTSSYSMASTELQIRPLVHRPQPVRPPTRSFHFPVDPQIPEHSRPSLAVSTRLPLGRSQTSPYHPAGQRMGGTGPLTRGSIELQRSGSDHLKRPSGDWWGVLRPRGAVPVSPADGSERAASPRSDAPTSPAVRAVQNVSSDRGSIELDRSSSDGGWLEWGRKRLSSMTSLSSVLVDVSEPPKTIAEQVAQKLASSGQQTTTQQRRPRRNSESAAVVFGQAAQYADAPAELKSDGMSSAPLESHDAVAIRSLTNASRARSTLSLHSVSSADTDSSTGQAFSQFGVSSMPRSSTHASFRNSVGGGSNLSRSRRYRNNILSAQAAPPQLQLDSAVTAFSSMVTAGPPTSPKSGTSAPTRPSSLQLDHLTSHTRFGSTPFSPIAEVMTAPLPTSADCHSPTKTIHGVDTAVPPTPKDSSSFPSDTVPSPAALHDAIDLLQ